MVKKYYVVRKGRKPGIYDTWPECQQQVNGYPNARYKSFTTLAEANRWFAGDDEKKSQSTVKQVLLPNAVRVYTDGGSRNHGNKLGQHVKSDDKAAWAYLIKTGMNEYTDTAGEFGVTNNRMEITALLKALGKLLELNLQAKTIVAILDSHYVLDPIMKGWLKGWQLRGWKTASLTPVANKDLWQKW